MPFCGVTLRGRKPLPECYPKEIKTLADRIRKRRLDLGLRQCGVGQLLGVHVTTVTNWELGRSEPALRYLPVLLRFLGSSPVNATQDSLPIPQQLKAYRRLHGLSQKRLAALLSVDPSTVWHWERALTTPSPESQARIRTVLAVNPGFVAPHGTTQDPLAHGRAKGLPHPPTHD